MLFEIKPNENPNLPKLHKYIKIYPKPIQNAMIGEIDQNKMRKLEL